MAIKKVSLTDQERSNLYMASFKRASSGTAYDNRRHNRVMDKTKYEEWETTYVNKYVNANGEEKVIKNGENTTGWAPKPIDGTVKHDFELEEIDFNWMYGVLQKHEGWIGPAKVVESLLITFGHKWGDE